MSQSFWERERSFKVIWYEIYLSVKLAAAIFYGKEVRKYSFVHFNTEGEFKFLRMRLLFNMIIDEDDGPWITLWKMQDSILIW